MTDFDLTQIKAARDKHTLDCLHVDMKETKVMLKELLQMLHDVNVTLTMQEHTIAELACIP